MSFQDEHVESRTSSDEIVQRYMQLLFVCEVTETISRDEASSWNDSGDDARAQPWHDLADLARDASRAVKRVPGHDDLVSDIERKAAARSEALSQAIEESKNRF